MTRFTTADHPFMHNTRWNAEAPAVRVTDDVWTSPATTDCHLVASDEGDVMVNTGYKYAGARHRERFEEAVGRPLDVRVIVLTQGYHEQSGGWAAFNGPGVETIAHRGHWDVVFDQDALKPFFKPRNRRVLASMMPPGIPQGEQRAEPDHRVTTYVDRFHAFEVGGRRFELHAVPGGETDDCLAVWLPDERVLLSGNFMGAVYGALPNFYTIRGTRLRSLRRFLASAQLILDLEPEVHVIGHGPPAYGAERIRRDTQRIIDAVSYIHDRTIEGMNAGKDLWTLMEEVRLPPELEAELAPGRGPVRWYVRSVWEEYVGWFRMESVTELYGVPPSAVWADLAELAGSVDRLAERAAEHLAAGRPLHAVHLTEIALAADPVHRRSLEVQRGAVEALLDGAENAFDLLGFLESELARLDEALSGPAGPS
jgi:glyoxylase-like metal-dependent hydrolase (beta-lactamase superfamily II)